MSKTTKIIRWRNRRKRNRAHKGRPSLRWLGVLALLGMIGVAMLTAGVWAVGTAVYTTLTADLPDYNQLTRLNQDSSMGSTQILAWADADQTETVLIDEIVDPLNGQRRWQTLDTTPQVLIDATVAAEEPGFWTANFRLWPVNPSENIPIVQQAVRSNLLEPNASDIEERLLAHRAANDYSREQVLVWYLNTRYYGNLAFGVQAAARVYFDKPLDDLTLAEAAMLAASSSSTNPFDTPEAAKIKQENVLATMAGMGTISENVLAAATAVPLQIAPRSADRSDIIAPHFALYVRQELERHFGPKMLLTGDMRVFTSLNLELQGQAECVARAQVNRLSGQIGPALPADELAGCDALKFLSPMDTAVLGLNQQVDNTAVVVLDAKTAEIRALVGSVNYWDDTINGPFNMVVDGRRQPGTIFTPFTYLTAVSQGYTASTMVLDVETDFGTGISDEPYIPQNEDGRFHGPMRLREALGNGYHVPAIQVASWVGMDKVIGTARSLGLTTLESGSYDLSLSLGGGETSLLDMTYAYTVLANMGVMTGQAGENGRLLDPVAIVRVEDQTGTILYDYYEQVQQRDILAPQLAYLMNDILADRSARCAAFGCPNVLELPANRPAAVKTGATNDFRDAWTIGYTPQLVTGVWVGNGDNRVMDGVTGLQGAAPIWQALMAWSLQDAPVSIWSQPPGLVETAVCDISGLLATEHCPAVSELFIQGTQPTVFDTIYQELAVNRETGRLATIYTPSELVENWIYLVYPEAAVDWAQAEGVELPPTDFDTIAIATTVNEDTAVTFPHPLSVISNTITIRGTARGDNFAYYRLAYFAGLAPSNLQTIAENVTIPKTKTALGRWDTTQLNGLYTLLLTVVQQDGNFEEISIPVTIKNSE